MKSLRLLALSGALSAGCYATLDVTKIDDTSQAEGVRVALPARYIEVKPTPSGGISVRPLHLPDPNARFAIDGWAVLASFDLDVSTSDGVLTSVTWNAKTDEVATEALGAAAAIEVARQEAEAEAEKAADEARIKQSDAIRAAELAVAEATATYHAALVMYGAGSKELHDAELALEIAQLRLAHLLGQAAPETELPDGSHDGLHDGAHDERAQIGDSQRAWGPMLFRIVEGIDDNGHLYVRLVPAHPQQQFRTIGIPTQPERPSHEPPRPTGDPPGDVLQRRDDRWVGAVGFTKPFTRVEIAKLLLVEGGDGAADDTHRLMWNCAPDPNQGDLLRIEMDGAIPPGWVFELHLICYYRPLLAEDDLSTAVQLALRTPSAPR